VDAAVVSKVRGIVKSIGVSAGRTAEPGTPLATILVPERGYSVSITVTAEQAKKVTVGDEAEVVTGWWYSGDITARLSSIRPDPNAPNTSRILNFDIRGEVEDGTQISLSIGQKSQNYDIIVPNSAVRSDTNGDFVLIVVAKNSPLGNRYVATRVDVQVLAKDDLNTAVSGGVANGDFVITTSTRPLESGMLVRLAEG
jgi:multidrug efflux pump subunit AcrA (membrane-fusion protein)